MCTNASHLLILTTIMQRGVTNLNDFAYAARPGFRYVIAFGTWRTDFSSPFTLAFSKIAKTLLPAIQKLPCRGGMLSLFSSLIVFWPVYTFTDCKVSILSLQ